MNKKRLDNLSDLRRQREFIRRIAVGALLAAGVFSLGSCDGLKSRDVSMTPSAATSLQGASRASGATAGRRL